MTTDNTIYIYHNGHSNADTVSVCYTDEICREFEWSKMNPFSLRNLLRDLGHSVELIEYTFGSDEET